MYLSRIVVKNFRSFKHLDVALTKSTNFVLGENNTGKSNLLHAIRLCLDSSLPLSYRLLTEADINTECDFTHPNQVIIGIEIRDFKGRTNEEGLISAWTSAEDFARIYYRFRPKPAVREKLASGDLSAGDLEFEDYTWELYAGGDPRIDLSDIEWDTEIGTSVRFSDLQAYLVVYMPALRDVETELRQWRNSPLAKLINASDITQSEQADLIQILADANVLINKSPTIHKIAQSIDLSLKSIVGKAFSLDVELGLSDPTFEAIIRSLKILLSNAAVKQFDPTRNGLGLNNILYIAILVEYFNKRIAKAKSAGQILLIEEPEAHLHPQLQLTLTHALSEMAFQSILTTHSTHISSQANFDSVIALTNTGAISTEGYHISDNPLISKSEAADLERYLDATKSNLLFARKVLLVEGAAELLLLPSLIRAVKKIDLEREGISIVAIHGAHFEVYAKLFQKGCLPKFCAILTDADQAEDDEGELPSRVDPKTLSSNYLEVFIGKSTFERDLVRAGNIPMLVAAAKEVGATKTAPKIRNLYDQWAKQTEKADKIKTANELKDTILKLAKRVGKARFAQVCARHVSATCQLPDYVEKALDWLTSK